GFFIRDSRGCISPEISVDIADSQPLSASSTSTNAVCTTGMATGSISTTLSDGSAPFDYHIYDISSSEVDSALGSTNSIETFNNLPQGSYTVVVTDAQGCSVRNELDIDQNVLDLIPLDSDPINCNDTSFPWRVRATGG